MKKSLLIAVAWGVIGAGYIAPSILWGMEMKKTSLLKKELSVYSSQAKIMEGMPHVKLNAKDWNVVDLESMDGSMKVIVINYNRGN